MYHTNIRWLNVSKVLKRVWSLKKEIWLFLEQKINTSKYPHFYDQHFLSDLAFAADITTHLSDWNVKLQGKGSFAHEMYFNT